SGCGATRTRWHYPACHTKADRMAAHRKSNRRLVCPGAVGLRKGATLLLHITLSLQCGEQPRQNFSHMKTTTLQLRNSVNRSNVRLAFLLILLACIAPSSQVRAVCQEGCDTVNANTFLGDIDG